MKSETAIEARRIFVKVLILAEKKTSLQTRPFPTRDTIQVRE
jgi:hypothetical protein